MAKRVSIQGKGAEIFFGDYAPGPPLPVEPSPTESPSTKRPEPSPRPRGPASPHEEASVPSHAPPGEPERAEAGEREQPRGGANSQERTGTPPTTRVHTFNGRAAEGVVRHSHDLYRDQVRWLNQLKLDIEVEYGQRVNGNDIVQLAVDLLRDEYEALGEQSNLISVLVFGKPRRRVRPRPPGGKEGA